MGHYLTCRYYRVRATLPYLIPAPPVLVPFGTFGAVIRIKSLFQNRRQLFDIGIAGPLAGFVFIVPALILGLYPSSQFEPTENLGDTFLVGEPLLFKLVAAWFFPGDSLYINLHPVGWAAWFGMLATSLNLLPIGQLDGGHIVYALLGGRGHRIVSYATFAGLILLGLYSWPMLGYLVFALVLLLLRLRHPRPYSLLQTVGRGRYCVALIGLVVFLLTFIPIPIQLVEDIGRL
jgi:membrane-associated protease RseP (regulator of RpoE activity)